MLDEDGAYRYFREVVDDLGGQLIRAGLVTQRQLSEVRSAAPPHDGALITALSQQGLSEDGLAGYFVAIGLGPLMEAADLAAADPSVTARVPGVMASALMALPIRESPAGLVVAMAAPTDEHAIHELARAAGTTVLPTVARVSDLTAALQRAHPDVASPPAPERTDSEPPVLELVRPKKSSGDGYLGSTKGAERVGARAAVRAHVASDDTEIFVPLVRKKPIARVHLPSEPAPAALKPASPGAAAPQPAAPDAGTSDSATSEPTAYERRVVTKSFTKLPKSGAVVPIGDEERALRPPGKLDPATHGLATSDTEVDQRLTANAPLDGDTIVALTPGPIVPPDPATQPSGRVASARFPKPRESEPPRTKNKKPTSKNSGLKVPGPKSRPSSKAKRPKPKAQPTSRARLEPKARPQPEASKAKPKAKTKATAKAQPKAKTKAQPTAKPQPKAKTQPRVKAKAQPKPKAQPKLEPKAQPSPKAKPEPKAPARTKPRSIIPAEHERWGSLGSTDNKIDKKTAEVLRDSRPPRPLARPPEIGGVLAAIRASRDRDEVVTQACKGALTVSRATVLLALRKSVLKGWGGAGIGISDDAVRNLWIPTSSPSMFREVVAKKRHYHGPSGTAAADGLFRAALGSRGGPVSLHPILIGAKLVAVLAADDMRFADEGRIRIETLARAVSEAFERIIVEKRRR